MSRLIIGATWEDSVPHLSEKAKSELKASYPKYQQDARTRGIPQLGSGAIYPFSESQIRIPDLEVIPRHWVRGFGLDTALGGTTAAVWAALDREAQVVYIYSVYKRAQAETAVHAEAMLARGKWIPGVGDAAGVADADRNTFLQKYRKHGFNITLPDKSVEVGIQDVYDRLSAGKLRVFASCLAWFEEFRLYRRDDKGRVVKQNDHLMDATRYLIHSGLSRMIVPPTQQEPIVTLANQGGYISQGGSGKFKWMR